MEIKLKLRERACTDYHYVSGINYPAEAIMAERLSSERER